MAVNKVIFGGSTLIDLTEDTVAADKLASGYTAHNAAGVRITGTASGGTDTSDATMNSGGQMLSGVTAYSKGVKYTGSIEDYDGAVDVLSVDPTLDNNSWATISSIAKAGNGANYWSVGDTKAVALLGKVGTLNINATLYLYILGFNHQNTNGITFQGFKTAQTSGINVCLVDSAYGATSTDGSKVFNMNHWGNNNYGGWMASDIRYDVLGSTDVAPSNYGTAGTTANVGYNASANTAKNPVDNTLMSCLPSDLRNVMRPMTVYTNNTGNSNNTSEAVTASVDYLPLLAEFEVFGTRTNANIYEQELQTRYDYYSAGNSAVKYRHSSTGSTAVWWCRSPRATSGTAFTHVSAGGATGIATTNTSQGLAPIFLV